MNLNLITATSNDSLYDYYELLYGPSTHSFVNHMTTVLLEGWGWGANGHRISFMSKCQRFMGYM